MTGKEYLNKLNNVAPDTDRSKKIESLYSENLPEIIFKIATDANETVFLDDDKRVLAYDEIIDAEKDLHIDFKGKGVVPLIDCGENDFIVYNFKTDIWSMFNIIDETIFRKKDSLDDLLK